MLKKLAELADELDALGQTKLANKLDAILQIVAERLILAETSALGPIADSNRMPEKNKLVQELLGILQSQKAVNLPPVYTDGVLTPQQVHEIERIAGKAGVGYKTYQELADKLLVEIRKKTPNVLLTFRIPA